jgi:hypothetical protein
LFLFFFLATCVPLWSMVTVSFLRSLPSRWLPTLTSDAWRLVALHRSTKKRTNGPASSVRPSLHHVTTSAQRTLQFRRLTRQRSFLLVLDYTNQERNVLSASVKMLEEGDRRRGDPPDLGFCCEPAWPVAAGGIARGCWYDHGFPVNHRCRRVGFLPWQDSF